MLASLIKTFPCVAAFMSSLTIVCVALDRFRCIVQSDRTQVLSRCPSHQSIEFTFLCFISCELCTTIEMC